MSVNFSSSSSDIYLHVSSINSSLSVFMNCFTSKPSSFVFTAFSIINTLLFLPLCTFMLYIGLHQCHPKCAASSSTSKMHHSDIFIFNMVTMQLIGVVGSVICCSGLYSNKLSILSVGCLVFSLSWYGQTMSHILTSMEGYLATVHPITYLNLRKQRGKRIRHISIICNWALAFAGMSLVMFDSLFIIMDLVLLMFSFAVILFCSLSVLWVLIRPGPGEQSKDRKKVDHFKLRAFINIVVTLGLLLLKFALNLSWVSMFMSGTGGCLVLMGCTFSSLPSSLILPLMFLRREGKLCCIQ